MTARTFGLNGPAVVAAFVAFVTVGVFFGVRHNGFIFLDDPYYLTENPWVRLGLTTENLLYAWTSRDVWNWHPLTWWSYLVDVELFGFDAGSHHLVSVALHAVSAALVAVIVCQVSQRLDVAAFIALAFAVHPQRVESVAWAAERKDVLCTLFFLMAVVAHLRGIGAEKSATGSIWRWRVFRFAAAVAALASKPMAVTLPPALLLLDLWPAGFPLQPRVLLRRCVEKTELFVASAAVAVLTLWAQSRMLPPAVPPAERFGDAAWALCCYVSEFVLPIALSFSHPRIDERPFAMVIVVAVVVVAGMVIAAVVLHARWPMVTVGWLWFCGLLFPVLGFVRIGSALYADRYMYLPSLGLLAVVVFVIGRVVRQRWMQRAVGLVVVVAYSALTMHLVSAWRSSESLVAYGLSVAPANADLLLLAARASADHGDLATAHIAAQEAENVRGNADTADFLGQVLVRQGRRAAARQAFLLAVQREPGHVLAHVHLGELSLAEGDIANATASLEEAVRHDRSRRTLLALARVRERAGAVDAAHALREQAQALPDERGAGGPHGAFPDPTPGDASASRAPLEPPASPPAPAPVPP
jgi:hypothetical protein